MERATQTAFEIAQASWATPRSIEGTLAGETVLGRRGVAIFLSSLALYFVHYGPRTQVDCLPVPYTAWSLARYGDFNLNRYPELAKLVPGTIADLDDGRSVSRVPPGAAFAAVPLVAPFAFAMDRPMSTGKMRRLGKWVAALHVAGAVALFYLLCCAVAPSGAAIATVVFGFGTCVFSVASQALWSHGPALFWLTFALYRLALRGESGGVAHFAMVGLGLGFAFAIRPSTALFALATLAALGWRGRWRPAVAVAAGGVLPALGLLVYNAHHFGEPVSGGYIDLPAMWTTPWSVGIAGLLVAPSRGIFVYTPALLVLPFGLRSLLAREAEGGPFVRTMLLFWLGAALASLLLFARSNWWSGEWSYGPRYLIESMPVLCTLIALAAATPRFRAGAGRHLLVGLVGLSVAIHTLGVFSDDRGAWHRRHPESAQLFELRDSQIESAARHLLGIRPAPSPRR